MRVRNTDCCGLGEAIIGADSATVFLKSLYKKMYKRQYHEPTRKAFYVFTDTVRSKKGKDIVAFVKKNKLGKVVGLAPKKNPNSGNQLQVWIFSPQEKAFKDWYKKFEISEKITIAKRAKTKAENDLKKAVETLIKLDTPKAKPVKKAKAVKK